MNDKLFRNLGAFRTIDPNFSAAMAMAFLVIGEHDGEITVSEVADAIDVSVPTASRYIASLSTSLNRHKVEGFGLIEMHEDVMERRRKLLRLTVKGRLFLKQLG